MTLTFCEKQWALFHTDYTIRNASSRHEVFRIGTKLSSHKALVDADTRLPIAHMRRAHFKLKQQTRICADRDGQNEMFVLKSTSSKEVLVEFRNVVDGQPVTVGMHGTWKGAIVWLDQHRNGQRLPVARICGPQRSQSYYHVDIASNMDQALVVLLCVGLDQRRTAEGGAIELDGVQHMQIRAMARRVDNV